MQPPPSAFQKNNRAISNYAYEGYLLEFNIVGVFLLDVPPRRDVCNLFHRSSSQQEFYHYLSRLVFLIFSLPYSLLPLLRLQLWQPPLSTTTLLLLFYTPIPYHMFFVIFLILSPFTFFPSRLSSIDCPFIRRVSIYFFYILFNNHFLTNNDEQQNDDIVRLSWYAFKL